MEARAPLSHDDYTVSWICALPVETAAAKLMLDEIHPSLPRLPMDQNTYILGSIGEHNVVVATLPGGAYGNTSAATVGVQLLSSFHSIRIGFMVGIGGGIPSSNTDIRLGDIVVSQPTDTSGGVIQYDLGKALSAGQFKRTGILNRPPKVLLTALATLQAYHFTEDSRTVEFISNMHAKMGPDKATKFTRPTQEDCLFQAHYDHIACDTCIYCDRTKLFPRPPREHQQPVIHYGLIGSANQVIKDGRRRDQLARDLGICCVEMEAAGLMNDFPCLVIRGICDYADSHKNKEWQGYAAAVAAAYAKELLLMVSIDQINSSPTTRDTLADFGQSQNTKAVNDEEVEQRAKDVLKWLAIEGNSRWLIIFDNIDQYSPFNGPISDAFDIAEFFPRADHGSILITSRLQGLTELGMSFPIQRLDLKDAIQLLLLSSRLSVNSAVKELEDTVALANRLDGLPLAIVVAGAFMRETGTSITEYLQFYQASWSDLQLQSNPERQYQQGNMLQTWMISYREIQKRDANAAKLLLFLARFDNRDIWFEVIQSSCHSSNVPEWLETSISSGLAFKIGVKALIGFSLLEIMEREGGYAMHPVVQDWCIHLASTNRSVHSIQLNELAPISVGYTVPSSSIRDYSELQQRLIPHANYGRLKEAEEMYRRALAGKEKVLGPDHTSTLITVNNLGNLYSNQGKLEEAEKIYQRALIGYEKALGPDHTFTLGTVNNLGLLYSNQGKLEEAEEMYQRALIGYEKALGPHHTSTLITVNNLGLFYKDQGKLEEAEEIYQRALTGYEEAFGPDHKPTLTTLDSLGNLYFD
ncbi:hypothetical protein N7526_001265 [Penicillium atrosanguineum]|nr:hypothetical protein N7526_001265 [Penicillium atrosanguineum]